MLETAEGISKGLLKAGKDFVKGIFDFATHPVKTIERTMDAIVHPIETYDYLSKSITDSFQRDVINGDAKSRAEWISYALGTLGLSVVGTKGLGAVSKTGMTTVKATTKVGVHKVKGAAQKIPTLNLYPYAPQHQLTGVDAGIVPYNTVNSVGLRDQLIFMAKMEARGSGTKGTGNSEIKYPLSSTNKKHINKHNIESIKQQSKYLSDSQLADKLESSFFNPKWSQEDINKYAEIAYNDLKNQGKTGNLTYEIGGEIIDVFIHPDGQFGSIYGRHKFAVEDIRKMTK
ncbi:hypothetical protein [Rummeliibacillus sp. SL167]|uniref:hypothetical protein n=1 Tax=Rummeliibacillus sp. SL167 TaxID=2579792 RepID=UPI0011B54EC3|nr:hypothetical protein [Rummeliibacillus sp. SL167]